VRDVDLAEAALLAGLPQSPERLSPRKHPDAAKARQRYVLGQMADHGFIARKEAERVAAQPIRLARETARGARPGRRRGRRRRAVPLRQDGRERRVRGRHHHSDHARRAPAGPGPPTLERGWRISTHARAARPVRSRDRQDARHPAAGAREGIREVPQGHEIVEGIVIRFEKDAMSPKAGKLFVRRRRPAFHEAPPARDGCPGGSWRPR
jgi:hypothetical protein